MARSIDLEREHRARAQVFDWLSARLGAGTSLLHIDSLANDFEWEGRKLALADRGGRGIHNPSALDATLSVLTTWRDAAASRYADAIDESTGVISYAYQRQEKGTNTKLEIAAERRLPIVYFRGESPGLYSATFPVYVDADPVRRVFTLHLDRVRLFGAEGAYDEAPQRSYMERTMWQRVHQQAFRGKVMRAYRERCAVCRLAHPRLLDAAHILGDKHELGVPVTSNGLSLCKIHHGAYDSDMLGIGPDLRVVISKAVLAETDGPMLRHGLQDMHGTTISIPHRPADRPDRDRLAERFEAFVRADP